MGFATFNTTPQPPCTSLQQIPDDIIVEIFTYLVFDDLQDCTGVNTAFHHNASEAIIFLKRLGLVSTPYYAESRVSYKLARVRLGINTVVGTSRASCADKENMSISKSKGPAVKKWKLTTRTQQQHPKILSTLPIISTTKVKNVYKHVKSRYCQSQPGEPIGQRSENTRSIRKKNNKKSKQVTKDQESRTPSAISSSRVYIIGRPKKAATTQAPNVPKSNFPYAPVPPAKPFKTRTDLYDLSGRRNKHHIKKRNKTKKKMPAGHFCHFFEIIGREQYAKWRNYKRTKGGKVKDMDRYKFEQKKKMLHTKKAVRTGLVSRAMQDDSSFNKGRVVSSFR